MVGFYLKKFVAERVDGKYSEVTFERGLNVISGPSSTGKSFIFQCINYVLGSSKEPKKIPQAEKYHYLYLEIETYNGKVYTIRRKIGDKDVTIIEGNTDVATEAITEGVSLSAKKLPKGSKEEDLTSFLLRLSGLSKQIQLSTNKRNLKSELSFRDVARVILLDELAIQSENSPLTTGDVKSLTREQSVFKMLLTGEDDSALVEIPDSKITKNKILSKIEQLKSTLARLTTKKEVFERQDSSIQDRPTFDKIIEELSDLERKIQQYTTKRSELWHEKNSLSQTLYADSQLLSRFKILEQQYSTDLERINFILSGTEQVEKLDIKECVCLLCGSDLNQLLTKPTIGTVFLTSLEAEKSKIGASLADLKNSISDLKLSIEGAERKISELSDLIEKIEVKIENELDPVKNSLSNQVKGLITQEKLLSREQEIGIEIKETEIEIDILKQELEHIVKEGSRPKPDRKILMKLEERIQSILLEWSFINESSTVSFDYETLDISINGKARHVDGKGKRSLIAAAYLITFMIYCIENDMPHPGFVLIDSPLTPYRDSDEIADNDRLSDKVHKSFYENLSKLPKNMQLIVIENKDPSTGITENIHYEHFTNKTDEGRQGFLEISDEAPE